MIFAVIGALIISYDEGDPEWKFQAGYVADLLENGSPTPQGQALSALCRVAGKNLSTSQEIIKWGRAKEKELN